MVLQTWSSERGKSSGTFLHHGGVVAQWLLDLIAAILGPFSEVESIKGRPLSPARSSRWLQSSSIRDELIVIHRCLMDACTQRKGVTIALSLIFSPNPKLASDLAANHPRDPDNTYNQRRGSHDTKMASCQSICYRQSSRLTVAASKSRS